MFEKKFCSIHDLTKLDVQKIFKITQNIQNNHWNDLPQLNQHTGALLFFEPSTRTHCSFQIACQRLGLPILSFEPEQSSLKKGESSLDTIKNLEAMGVDLFIVRHQEEQFCQNLAKQLKPSTLLINAGTGTTDHPSQALLDVYTIQQQKGDSRDLKIVIVGDIIHSRVAHSNLHLLNKMGYENIVLIGPPDFLPEPESFPEYARQHDLSQALEHADVIMMLRIQQERLAQGRLPNLEKYHSLYGLTSKQLGVAKPDAIVMHPGPINRGVEISSEVADGAQSAILKQVTHGIWVRMALILWLMGVNV